jgi:hypothetical protein
MNTRQQFLSFTFLLLTSTSLFGEAPCPGNVVPVRYHSLEHSQIGVPVRINDLGPYEFLLDTGAQLTVVEPSLAAELRLPARNTVGVISVTHYAEVPVALAERVEVGSVAVQRPLIAVENLDRLRTLYPNVRGKLGESFLAHFDVLIDYAHKIVCLDENGAMRGQLQGERVPLVAQQSQPGNLPVAQPILISVQFTTGSSRGTILRLDSGTNVALLYAGRLEAPFWKQVQNARQCAAMGGSLVSLTEMPPQDLRVGARWLRGIAFMTPVRTGNIVTIAGEDGLLPTTLFKRVFISHADHFVIIDPKF